MNTAALIAPKSAGDGPASTELPARRRSPKVSAGDGQLSFMQEMPKASVQAAVPRVFGNQVLTVSTAPCAGCVRDLDSRCNICAARRPKAMALWREGKTVRQIAAAMKLSDLRVMRLLEQEASRLRAEDFRDSDEGEDRVSVEVVRDLYEEWLAVEPEDRNASVLARLADYSCSTYVRRLLGYVDTSEVRKGEKVYPRRKQTDMPYRAACRLVIAMGYDPSVLENGH